jgi:hypothetical protein
MIFSVEIGSLLFQSFPWRTSPTDANAFAAETREHWTRDVNPKGNKRLR